MSYIMVLFAVGLVILAHEFGHLLGARAAGIPVRTFSIGFGPRVWGRIKNGTDYRVSLVPLGGYVLPDVDDEKEFFAYPVYKRMLLTIGGPLASLVFPLCCFAVFNAVKYGASFSGVLIKPFIQVFTLFYKILVMLPAIFSHHENVSGIVGIVAQGGQIVSAGAANILYFMAVISINFAVINLVPIPALDGGKMVLFLSEKIHPKMARLHYPLAVAGWLIILGLTVYTTVIDIGRFTLG